MKFTSVEDLKNKNKFVFALMGNPNVGKSTIFNQLTGLGVETANYAGKNIKINLAAIKFNNMDIGLVDLPGIYAVGGFSEDQWVARQVLLKERLDAVIVILDASNLARNLYLLLQLMDLGFPVVLAVNLADLAKKQNIQVDYKELARWLGIKVTPTIGIRGEGLEEVLSEAVKLAGEKKVPRRMFSYGADIEEEIFLLAAEFENIKVHLPFALPSWAWAILALEQDEQLLSLLREAKVSQKFLEKISFSQKRISGIHSQSSAMRMAKERHVLAGSIAAMCQKKDITLASDDLTDKLWYFATHKIFGFVFLALCLSLIFSILFYFGNFLSRALSRGWLVFVSPVLNKFLEFIFGQFVARVIAWGLDNGILSALTVGIPYILVFYFLLAFLEDTGYLTAFAFLIDKFMHFVGLHGRAAICLVAGLGCNVPAIIGTRVLITTREKIIANFLISLVPCSARIAIVAGGVALFVGPLWALSIFFISFLLIVASGVFLNKVLPDESSGLVMEVFSFRNPSMNNILKKTWYRFKEFIFVATPIIIVGSILLGLLYETGLIFKLTAFMGPVVEGWMGLPSVCGLALLFGILRKELALQLLFALAIIQYGKSIDSLLIFMTKKQIFIYALVSVIYVPCIATITAIAKELGMKKAIYISLGTIILAVLAGGLANRILSVWHIL